MKKFMVAAMFASITLTACGGGGGSDDSGSTPTPTPTPVAGKIAFTPVNDVSAIVGSQVSTLATAKISSGFRFISEAYADSIETHTKLVATDVGGNQFETGFVDSETGAVTTETVEPTGMTSIDADHALVELFVTTNKTTNAKEFRHYLVEYSTGKMILIETLANIGNAWAGKTMFHVAAPNTVHNGLQNEILFLNESKQWVAVTPDWTASTFTSRVVATAETGGSPYPILSITVASNGDVYKTNMGVTTRNGATVALDYTTGVFQKDGATYIAGTVNGTDPGVVLYTVDANGVLARVAVPAVESQRMINGNIIAFDGVSFKTNGCEEFALDANSGTFRHVYSPVDVETMSYDAYVAGDGVVCTGNPVNYARAARVVDKAVAARSAFPYDEACDLSTSHTYTIISVNGEGVERRIDNVEDGVMSTIPTSRETAYLSQLVCTPAGGDGVSAAKWTGSYANTEADFVANELRPLNAPVVMAVVN